MLFEMICLGCESVSLSVDMSERYSGKEMIAACGRCHGNRAVGPVVPRKGWGGTCARGLPSLMSSFI